MKELVSVIVPAYNAETTIERCIYSILNQTYRNIEIIIINDGSKDKTEKLLEKIVDERIIIITISNSGVSNARNIGIEKANGEFIIFVDSDDYLKRNMIEELINNRNFFTICNYNRVNNKKSIENINDGKIHFFHLKEQFLYLFDNKKLLNQPWGKLYETKIIVDKNIRFNTDLSLGEDLIFNLEYLRNIEYVTLVDKSLYNYTVGNCKSLCKKYHKDMLDIQDCIKDELIKYGKCLKLDECDMKKIYKKSLRFLLSSITNEFHSDKKNKLTAAKNIMKNSKIQNYTINIYKNKCIDKKCYFIIKHNLVIIYILFRNHII